MDYKDLSSKVKEVVGKKAQTPSLEEDEKFTHKAFHLHNPNISSLLFHSPNDTIEYQACVISKPWNLETKHTCDYSFPLKNLESDQEFDLSHKNIHHWNLEKYQKLKKKFPNLKQKHNWLPKFCLLNLKENNVSLNPNSPWEELSDQVDPKILIGRITNYFIYF